MTCGCLNIKRVAEFNTSLVENNCTLLICIVYGLNCMSKWVICISSSSSYFFNYAFIKKIKLLHSRERGKRDHDERNARRTAYAPTKPNIVDNEDWSEGESKRKKITIHFNSCKNEWVRERERRNFFILKEKRRTFDSRAQIFSVAAKRAPAPTSADLSDLNKKLLQYVSFSLSPARFLPLSSRCHTRFILMRMHTQMFYSKGLIFLSLSLLHRIHVRTYCPDFIFKV